MRVLAVDTTSESLRLALADGKWSWTRSLRCPGAQDLALWPNLRRLLRGAGRRLGDIEALAVASGPGSFTGVRVGMTFASVLAGSLEIPAVGVSLLDAEAFRAYPGSPRDPPGGSSELGGLLIVVLPSVRDELFVQGFRTSSNAPQPLGPPLWLRAADWRARFQRLSRGGEAALAGGGAREAARLLPPGARVRVLKSAPLSARDLVAPALDRLRDGRAELSPLYLKPAYYERGA